MAASTDHKTIKEMYQQFEAYIVARDAAASTDRRTIQEHYKEFKARYGDLVKAFTTDEADKQSKEKALDQAEEGSVEKALDQAEKESEKIAVDEAEKEPKEKALDQAEKKSEEPSSPSNRGITSQTILPELGDKQPFSKLQNNGPLPLSLMVSKRSKAEILLTREVLYRNHGCVDNNDQESDKDDASN